MCVAGSELGSYEEVDERIEDSGSGSLICMCFLYGAGSRGVECLTTMWRPHVRGGI